MDSNSNAQTTWSKEASKEAPETKQNKEKRSGIKYFLGGVLVGVLVVGCISAIVMYHSTKGSVKVASSSTSEKGKEKSDGNELIVDAQMVHKLEALDDAVKNYYLQDVDSGKLHDSVYHGFIEGLEDPYSTYYSKEELESFMESTEGIYYGIGAYIGFDEKKGYCKITKAMDGSPALEAGLQAEDIIVEVDGEDMKDVSTSEIVTYIKGPEGTTVDLKIYREGELDYLNFTVERRKIETPTVALEMDEETGIAVISISEFDEVTAAQFEENLNKAKEQGMKGMIIDLRDNPGGSLQTVVDIASDILPAGTIVYTEDKYGNKKEYNSDGRHELEVPLAVLVNGNSASASEILSGAIKDYKKGTIVGTTTFGKGIVQKIFSLTDGSAIKLTISHYYTPNGNDIHGVGIAPDVELELDTEKYLEDRTDNQMDKAKEIVTSEISK